MLALEPTAGEYAPSPAEPAAAYQQSKFDMFRAQGNEQRSGYSPDMDHTIVERVKWLGKNDDPG